MAGENKSFYPFFISINVASIASQFLSVVLVVFMEHLLFHSFSISELRDFFLSAFSW